MNAQQRIDKIEIFVHSQKYVHGAMFHVLEEGEDKFVIEFQEATERQISTMLHALSSNFMSHITVRAIKIIEEKHGNRNNKRAK